MEDIAETAAAVAPITEVPAKKSKPAAKKPAVKKVVDHPSYDVMVLATLHDLKEAQLKIGYSYRNILAHMSAKYGLASSGLTRNAVKNSIEKLIEEEAVKVKLADGAGGSL